MALLNKWGVAAVAVASMAALATGVVAQDKAAAVKARQDFMKAQAADTKAINDYSKGMGSKADAEKAIADLQSRNGKILALFVPGTSMADLPGVSYAKPAAFTDTAKLKEVVATLKSAEDKTADVIKTGAPDAVGAAAGDLGKAGCGGCHTTYRERKPT
ncbi:MAG TPA: cytochrome c [Caulobacteraceae bacterium]|jgi:cytochrome c556